MTDLLTPDLDDVATVDEEPAEDEPIDDDAAADEVDLAGLPPLTRWPRQFAALEPWAQVGVVLEVLVLVAAVVFTFVQLGPDNLLADTTPAGGDMGAHVWGPAFLRDHLLPDLRLAGWAPDWYAGFPAYQFYMVVPALFIVLLDAGWEGWAALVPLAIGLWLLWVSLVHDERRVRRLAFVGGLVVVLLGCGLPYGVAFKLVTVAGVLALPVCAYVAGRLAELPFPGPTMLSLGSMLFLYNRQPAENATGHIIGGNIMSTLAGEFSFSISLAFLVLYLGFLLRGLRRGGYRATAAVLLALTALCHVIPAIYGVVITVFALLFSVPLTRERLRWFLPVGPVAVAISAFWIGPFVLRRGYLNDMGWEKIPSGIREVPLSDFLWTFWFDDSRDALRGELLDALFPSELWWVFGLAVAGLLASAILKIRLGLVLGCTALATVVLFVVTPQGRLWNARLLPLLLLSACLLAGLAISEVARSVTVLVSRPGEGPAHPVTIATSAVAAVAVALYLSFGLGILAGAEQQADGAERWLWWEISSEDRTPLRGWADWNYRGYERKDAFPEYHSMVSMMRGVADDPDLGCGRAMWEYEFDRLNRYGTPMAPMLLPFWTDGCIGSMEGLYFEASATTPYHFLNQGNLSARCSCAQRDLPYGGGFDIDLGVQQLQQMGVRYYLAFSDVAVQAADQHPDLTEVAADDVWHVYLVADSDPVVPLEHEPAVLTGLEPGMAWVGPNSKWFQDPERWDVLYAEDGPEEWQRIEVGIPEDGKPGGSTPDPTRPTWAVSDVLQQPEARPVGETQVSGVEVDRDAIRFDVTEVGVPVLVRASYFPNWRASGAEGPYRVSPNLMVVVPTDTHVELSYGWTAVDAGSYAVTAVGIGGAIFLARDPRRRGEDDDDDDVFFDGPQPW